ncbi:MAG: tetratricopeptide repeat protein [Terriglobia bacterium]|nr:tetratricopeptide repeat protein [Terriglobia bacterium]
MLVIVLLGGFTVTGFITRGYKARQEMLAVRWFSRGDRDLAAGNPARAVDEIQTALAFAPNDDTYRLKLALALMRSGQLPEARVHLANLWEERPGDATVNLQLARVMARMGDAQEAVRYYHGAIYGVWETHPLQNREAVRFELVNYLLSSHQIAGAQAELIALAAELPPNSAQQVKLGDLMMEADQPDRALIAYKNARKANRNNAQADLGAAQAAFALRKYTEARDYARLAVRIDPKMEEATQLEKQSQLILSTDPYAKGINIKTRAERAQAAYEGASDRLNDCLTNHNDPALQQLATQQASNFKRIRPWILQRDPDLLDNVVSWAYQVEATSEGTCGAPTGVDAALLVLAHGAGAR